MREPGRCSSNAGLHDDQSCFGRNEVVVPFFQSRVDVIRVEDDLKQNIIYKRTIDSFACLDEVRDVFCYSLPFSPALLAPLERGIGKDVPKQLYQCFIFNRVLIRLIIKFEMRKFKYGCVVGQNFFY